MTVKVAVVGHTNTGKTSLLRTLTRDPNFGEVANRPSTTRHVEGTALLVNGRPAVEFYDTPGLEDSITLLEHLEDRNQETDDWVALIDLFLVSEDAKAHFSQETKSLRQIVGCDIVLYVIDVRERLLGKYRDELTILARTAKPVIPLLNFVDSVDAKAEQWRQYLIRAGLHASLQFNPLVIDAVAEHKLFERMRALHDDLYEPLGAVIADLDQQRLRLQSVAADLIAELLIDVSACVLTVAAKDEANISANKTRLATLVRQREWDCAKELLRLFGFRAEDYSPTDLFVGDAQTGTDLLNPTALKQLGKRGGSGAAAGAAAGLTVDVIFAGLTLGIGTATGAGIGALFNIREQGMRAFNKIRGLTELRLGDAAIVLLAARQITLAQALLRRGHADPKPVALSASAVDEHSSDLSLRLPELLQIARNSPVWSRLEQASASANLTDPKRIQNKQTVATALEKCLR